MIEKVFSQISQFAGLNNLIRTLFLWFMLVGLQILFYWLSYSQGINDIIDFFKNARLIIPGELNLIIIGLVGLFFFLDILIKFGLSFILPLLSGKILPLSLLKEYHKKRRARLAKKLKKNARLLNYLHSYYPNDEKDVAPTLLANIIKTAENYPYSRYDIDPGLIWPRLYQILPQANIFSITEEKENLLFYLNLAVITFLTPLFWGVAAILNGAAPPWWLFITCILMTWTFYRLSIKRALSYAKLFRVYFDLYRLDLLKKMGEEKVEDLHEEIAAWNKICRHLAIGDTPDEKLIGLFRRGK